MLLGMDSIKFSESKTVVGCELVCPWFNIFGRGATVLVLIQREKRDREGTNYHVPKIIIK